MGNSLVSGHRISFLLIKDKDHAKQLLDDAEKVDMYVEECHDDTANYRSRSALTYSPNQIGLRDMNYAITYLGGIKSVIPERLCTDLENINIIQLMPTADGGMPHTRPNNIICLPDISQLFSKTTLIHELWHIHQRTYKNEWLKIFNRLGWSLWNGELPEQLEKYRRFNPDTIDCPYWIFQDEWIPIPIFRDITHPKVGDVEIWFYNPHRRYHIKHVPSELSEYFRDLPPSAYEHPRELTAYMLSEPDRQENSAAFKHLIELMGITSITGQINI